MNFENVLAFESSCDDTSVAIVRSDGYVVEIQSAGQEDAHQPFGGVVPEIASRNHTIAMLPLVEEVLSHANMTMEQIDGIAVTNRPGLVGSLLVGLVTAKTFALSYDCPFVGVNHLEGHLVAPFLKDKKYSPPEDFSYPYLGLAISGGHTSLYVIEGFGRYRLVGQSIDDAAGEAFDKFAKMLGLGFPGGVLVDQKASSGRRDAFQFPRALAKEKNYDYSFSGVKTSARRLLETMDESEIQRQMPDLCASFQEAIVDALMIKLNRAIEGFSLDRVILTGGVSANSRLRQRASDWAQEKGLQLVIPPIRYCTDNAAMIGLAGIQRLNLGERASQDLGPSPRAYETDFIYG